MATATTERGDAALRVITEPMLWPHIISFQRGIPMWTIEYEQRYCPKHIMPFAVAEKLTGDDEKLQLCQSNYYTSQENAENTTTTVDGSEEASTPSIDTAPTAEDTAAERKPDSSTSESNNDTAAEPMLEPSSALLLRRGVPGLLPRIAIQQRDFATLKRLYQLHNSQPEIRKMGRFWLKSVMHHAAVDGSMELLQWLHENTEEKCQRNTMGHALRAGHFEIALWLRDNRPESMGVILPQDIAAVAAHGRLDLLEWLPRRHPESALNEAAQAGHLDVVKFLLPKRRRWISAMTMTIAAANGHLEVVQYLHEKRCPRSEDTMFCAVQGKHLDVVRFLWETRDTEASDTSMCPTVRGLKRAQIVALSNGDCEALRFMTDDAQLTLPLYGMSHAAVNGHLDAVKMLHASRPREDVVESLRRSAKANHTEVSSFLLENHTFQMHEIRDVIDRIENPQPDVQKLLDKQLGGVWLVEPQSGKTSPPNSSDGDVGCFSFTGTGTPKTAPRRGGRARGGGAVSGRGISRTATTARRK